jgi:ribonuclease-3
MEVAILAQSADLSQLGAALGYEFTRPELLAQALTHRTHTYELAMVTTGKPDVGRRNDNQRLEFLGDAVLGLVVAELLFKSHPDWQEGELSRMRVQFVNREYLAKVAGKIELGKRLRLSPERERAGGRKNEYILANAMEAVLGAMYLDASGSLAPVRRFAKKHILGQKAEELAEQLRSGGAMGDYKSALQFHLQGAHLGMPVYRLLDVSGPDHRKRFEADVRVRSNDGEVGESLAVGQGASRKKAEQEAARQALARLAEVAAASAEASPDRVRDEEPAGV